MQAKKRELRSDDHLLVQLRTRTAELAAEMSAVEAKLAAFDERKQASADRAAELRAAVQKAQQDQEKQRGEGAQARGRHAELSAEVTQHGQRGPLGSAPAQPAVPPQGAPGGSGQLGTPRGGGPATGRPATASGARASRLQRALADSTALYLIIQVTQVREKLCTHKADKHETEKARL